MDPGKNLETEIDEVLGKIVPAVLEVDWKSLHALLTGMRRSKLRGPGYDFDRIKEFDPDSDDPRTILQAATAATGGQQVFAKVTFGLKEIPIYVLVDVNKTLEFGTTRATKLRLCAELAASVIAAAEETHDRVGFMAYSSNTVHTYARLNSPSRVMFEALSTILRPPASTGGLDSGLDEALTMLPGKRSLVFVISDFLNLTDAQKEALADAGAVHDIVALVVQDKRERELPDTWGRLDIQDLRSGKRKTIWLTRANRRKYAEAFADHQRKLSEFFQQNMIRHLAVSTEEGDKVIPRLLTLFSTPGYVS